MLDAECNAKPAQFVIAASFRVNNELTPAERCRPEIVIEAVEPCRNAVAGEDACLAITIVGNHRRVATA